MNHRKDLASYCGQGYRWLLFSNASIPSVSDDLVLIFETIGLMKEMESKENICQGSVIVIMTNKYKNAPEKAGGDTATLPGRREAEPRVVGNRQ